MHLSCCLHKCLMTFLMKLLISTDVLFLVWQTCHSSPIVARTSTWWHSRLANVPISAVWPAQTEDALNGSCGSCCCVVLPGVLNATNAARSCPNCNPTRTISLCWVQLPVYRHGPLGTIHVAYIQCGAHSIPRLDHCKFIQSVYLCSP